MKGVIAGIGGLALTLGAALPSQAADPKLTMAGLGPVSLRMTTDQAVATGWVKLGLGLCPGERADFKRKFHARGIWDRDDRLVYISAQRTIRGIRVGSTKASVRAAFPDLRPVGRNIFTDRRIFGHQGASSLLQFTFAGGRVEQIMLTDGTVATTGNGDC